jgi:hypothetical protein
MKTYYRNIDSNWVESQKEELVQGEKYKVLLSFGSEIVGIWNPDIESNPIQINVTSVEFATMVNSEFTHITCNELENIVVKGTLNIPDRTFSMPIRRDDGRLILFPVNVANGVFEAVLNFPTSGQYCYSDVEANIDLPPNTFTVSKIKLDVLRKTN